MGSRQQPLVSVVSLTHNRKQHLAELLLALRQQTYPSLEVVVVENGSTDGTAHMIRRDFGEVILIDTGSNLGMVAYNLGFEAAQGDYVLVLDDDGLPASKDWVARVVSRFEANHRLGAVCCTIRMRDTGLVAYDSPQFAPVGDPAQGFEAAAYNGTGGGLRAEALHQVGHYPVPFFRSFLELHLCTRLIDAGWEVRYFPELEVWHSRSSGSTNRPATYYGLRSYFWYLWTLYPSPAVLREALRYLGYCLKLVLRRQLSIALLGRALLDSCLGWPSLSADRTPVSNETITYLQRVRSFHNRSALVPEYRPYVAADEEALCC